MPRASRAVSLSMAPPRITPLRIAPLRYTEQTSPTNEELDADDDSFDRRITMSENLVLARPDLMNPNFPKQHGKDLHCQWERKQKRKERDRVRSGLGKENVRPSKTKDSELQG